MVSISISDHMAGYTRFHIKDTGLKKRDISSLASHENVKDYGETGVELKNKGWVEQEVWEILLQTETWIHSIFS